MLIVMAPGPGSLGTWEPWAKQPEDLNAMEYAGFHTDPAVSFELNGCKAAQAKQDPVN